MKQQKNPQQNNKKMYSKMSKPYHFIAEVFAQNHWTPHTQKEIYPLK